MQQRNHKKHLGDHLVQPPHFTDTKIKVTEVKQFVQGQKTREGHVCTDRGAVGSPWAPSKGMG